jgi:plasmid replication initiation protein
LVDIRGAGGLSLFAGKVYNRLIHHAFGPGMAKQGEEFTIQLSELRGLHESNDRIGPVLEMLQKTIVKARLSDGRIRQVQLLGGVDFHDDDRPDGTLTYSFDKRLVVLLRQSNIFAKLELRVIYQFQSRYSLALYEAICRRVRKDQCVEEFSLADFREVLRVPDARHERFSELNRHAIQPAIAEVNFLADFEVSIRPRKRGKRVVGVTVAWAWKDKDARREAWAETQRPRVGRKARLKGQTDRIE